MLNIEKYPKMLQEYGRAIAWINVVEEYLKYVILTIVTFPGSYTQEILSEILDDMMLGKKITLIEKIKKEKLFPTKIIKDLRKLNDRRIVLVHGDISSLKIKGVEYLIKMHKGKHIDLTKDYLEGTTAIAKNIIVEFSKILKSFQSKGLLGKKS